MDASGMPGRQPGLVRALASQSDSEASAREVSQPSRQVSAFERVALSSIKNRQFVA
jgi:hypothetical protein